MFYFSAGKKPALLTVGKTAFEPRFPTQKSKVACRKTPIQIITAEDIPNIDLSRCGLKGSPTKVKKTFTPVRNKTCVKIAGEEAAVSAAKLASLLKDAKML